MYKNMKIEINEEQPLHEVVKELERLGYRKYGWSYIKNPVQVITYANNGWFSDFSTWVEDRDAKLTTLKELQQ